MAQKTLQTRIKLKKDTAANWENRNPVLLEGEQIFVITAAGETRVKVGDGTKTYTQLPFTDEPLRTLIGAKAEKTTTITAGSGLIGGGDLSANRTISHADTSSVSNVTASGRKYITGLTFDGYGHVTGTTTGTETVTDTGATKVSVTGSGNAITTASYDASTRTITLTKGATYNNYSLPVATSSALGGVKSGTDITVDSSGNVSIVNDSHTHSNSTITSLDASKLTGIIPTSLLPSYVDDVIEVANYNALPLTGESGKIYVDLATNLTYRWSGSAYVEVSPGTSVTYSQTLTSGTEIGKITVDGITTTLYTPEETFVVTLSTDDSGSYIADKTYEEILAAYNANKFIRVVAADGKTQLLFDLGTDSFIFTVINAKSRNVYTMASDSTVTKASSSNYASYLSMTSDSSSTTKLPILFSASTPTSGSYYKTSYNTNVTVLPSTGVLYGAAWNDYAEYRKFDGDKVEAGRVVTETGKDSVQYTNSRLQFAPAVISDTYGMVIGEDKEGNVPLAIGGKVLAYPYESRETYKVGDAVCSGPNGTVSRMTRKEIVEWPDRILGYYVGTPEDEEFNGVPVNGRIWIRIR